jgi:tetratricopeptide (TPR) repeat protein
MGNPFDLLSICYAIQLEEDPNRMC